MTWRRPTRGGDTPSSSRLLLPTLLFLLLLLLLLLLSGLRLLKTALSLHSDDTLLSWTGRDTETTRSTSQSKSIILGCGYYTAQISTGSHIRVNKLVYVAQLLADRYEQKKSARTGNRLRNASRNSAGTNWVKNKISATINVSYGQRPVKKVHNGPIGDLY